MGRKIAVLSLASWISALAFAPEALAYGGCGRGKGGGRYVTYNGSSFNTYNLSQSPARQPMASPYQNSGAAYQNYRAPYQGYRNTSPGYGAPYQVARAVNPSYAPYSPATPGGGFPMSPMMGY